MRLLLDTNVLLLLLIGLVRPEHIGRKRLESFTKGDFQMIANWAAEYSAHVSMPNILTEVSNLLGDAKQELVSGGRVALAKYIATLEEVYLPSQEVVAGSEFLRLGLTDAAILSFADKEVCVVSVDHNLCNRLSLKGVDVRNPLNFR